MKKILLTTLLAISLLTFAQAKSSDYMSRVIKLWNLKTNNEVDFNASKTKDGYNLLISSKNRLIKELLGNKPIKLKVDDGPLITTPNFTFGTAGLLAESSILDILNPKFIKDIKKSLKTTPKFRYEATISFGNELESKLTVDPFVIEDNSTRLSISKVLDTSSYDLDSYTGKESIEAKEVIFNQKSQEGNITLNNITLKSVVDQEPIDNFMMFVKSSYDIKEININTKNRDKKDLNLKLSTKFSGDTIRVDKDLLDLKIGYNIKALNENTIAFARGIKESKLNLEFKNLGISGTKALIELNKKFNRANQELLEASQKGDDMAMQKAILKTQEFANEIVPIWNKTFITNKSRVILDLKLISDKTSYVKLDMLYKAKPLSGNMQSAFISLMAQQLAIFDGTFDIAVDNSLVSSIYPFAIIGLDMLKAKGFVTVKNGIYYLKGELKGGKIVVNGKAYSLPELTKALF